MAMLTIPIPQTQNHSTLTAYLAKICSSFLYRASRQDHIDALEALTDAELAQMGLTRDHIAHYVWRDRMIA